jgi:hypothetical protein
MTPGSNEARARGCICPVMDNRYGAGQDRGGREPVFVVNLECSVHGADARKRAAATSVP